MGKNIFQTPDHLGSVRFGRDWLGRARTGPNGTGGMETGIFEGKADGMEVVFTKSSIHTYNKKVRKRNFPSGDDFF